MQRLLVDAQKISGIKYDINNLSDVYEAIHVIQGELGVTGTTAKEASATISGSVASAKASFSNFLSGAGSIDDVVKTFTTAGTNIGNAVIKMAPKIIQGIIQLINALLPQIPPLLQKLLPVVITGVQGILTGLVQMLPKILNILMGILPQLVGFITSMLPQILQALIQGAIMIITALAEQMPVLIPQIIEAILSMIPVLIDNLPLFIEAGYKLIVGLLSGIIQSTPKVIAYIPKIVKSIVNYLKKLPGLLLSVGANAIKQLGKAFANNMSWVVGKAKNVGKKVLSGIKNLLKPGALLDVGKNLVKGLWNGINNAKDWVLDKIKGFGKSVLSGIKGIFGIKSPSREMFKIGAFLDMGLVNGIDSMQDEIHGAFNNMFDLSPSLYGTASTNLSPNVNVVVNQNYKQDALGRVVRDIKTYAGGSRSDYNVGRGGV